MWSVYVCMDEQVRNYGVCVRARACMRERLTTGYSSLEHESIYRAPN